MRKLSGESVKILYEEYFKELIESEARNQRFIDPSILSTLKRELETIVEGYEFIGEASSMGGKKAIAVFKEASELARLQGYDPKVRLIPQVHRGGTHEILSELYICSWGFSVYAKHEGLSKKESSYTDVKLAISRVGQKLLHQGS